MDKHYDNCPTLVNKCGKCQKIKDSKWHFFTSESGIIHIFRCFINFEGKIYRVAQCGFKHKC